MKDIDIDNTIENAGCEKKEQLRAQLHTRIGVPQKERQIKSRRKISLKALAFGIAGMCAVCLAIVLPISLYNNTTPSSQDKFTYAAVDFLYDDLGLTIKEYSEQTGKNLLYIDWYDVADECVTTKYYLPDKEDDIIYIAEDLINGETGDCVWFAVVETNVFIDELETVRDICDMSYEYNNTQINWSYNINISRAYFVYQGYKYYFKLDYPTSEQAILDIVKDML